MKSTEISKLEPSKTKKSPFTVDLLDFTKRFKEEIFEYWEVFSFGVKKQGYQFYIELYYDADATHFNERFPFDLSKIDVTVRQDTQGYSSK